MNNNSNQLPQSFNIFKSSKILGAAVAVSTGIANVVAQKQQTSPLDQRLQMKF